MPRSPGSRHRETWSQVSFRAQTAAATPPGGRSQSAARVAELEFATRPRSEGPRDLAPSGANGDPRPPPASMVRKRVGIELTLFPESYDGLSLKTETPKDMKGNTPIHCLGSETVGPRYGRPRPRRRRRSAGLWPLWHIILAAPPSGLDPKTGPRSRLRGCRYPATWANRPFMLATASVVRV